MNVKALEATVALAGLGVYAEFFQTIVPTPLGVILALGLLPTGDLIRWTTAWIDRRRRRLERRAAE